MRIPTDFHRLVSPMAQALPCQKSDSSSPPYLSLSFRSPVPLLYYFTCAFWRNLNAILLLFDHAKYEGRILNELSLVQKTQSTLKYRLRVSRSAFLERKLREDHRYPQKTEPDRPNPRITDVVGKKARVDVRLRVPRVTCRMTSHV